MCHVLGIYSVSYQEFNVEAGAKTAKMRLNTWTDWGNRHACPVDINGMTAAHGPAIRGYQYLLAPRVSRCRNHISI